MLPPPSLWQPLPWRRPQRASGSPGAPTARHSLGRPQWRGGQEARSRLRAPQAARAPPSTFLRLSGRDRRSLSGEEARPPVSAGSPCVSPGRWHLSTLPRETGLASPSPRLACLELPSGWPHLGGRTATKCSQGSLLRTLRRASQALCGRLAICPKSLPGSFLRKGLLSCPLPQLELKILGS